MSDEEPEGALFEKVYELIWVGERDGWPLDELVSEVIAAVRAWDAEQGMVTVPREPTEEMMDAGVHGSGEGSEHVAAGAWFAMLAAAPQREGE